MNRYKLTKLSSTHNNLRTDEVVGWPLWELKLGHPFYFESEALDEAAKMDGAKRFVLTTPVIEVLVLGDTTEFKTANSHYKLEVLREPD